MNIINGWNQIGEYKFFRSLGNRKFALISIDNAADSQVHYLVVNVEEERRLYPVTVNKAVEFCCYESISEIYEEYGSKADSVIAECIFDYAFNSQILHTGSFKSCKKYINKYIKSN